MSKELTEKQQEVWDKLTYVPEPNLFDMDVNSMYPHQVDYLLGIQRMEAPTGKTYKMKVLKNR